MSNPTIVVEQFNGSLGAFTGVDPIRYDSGSWFEKSTTNLFTTPFLPVLQAYTQLTLSSPVVSITHPRTGQIITQASRATVTGVAGGQSFIGFYGSITPVSAGTNIAAQMLVVPSAALVGKTMSVYLSERTDSGALTNISTLAPVVLTGGPQIIERIGQTAVATSNKIYMYGNLPIPDQAMGATYDVTAVQFETGAVTTSFCPVLVSGSPITGYAWTGTAGSSTSTRAASSASVTIAAPAAVACWYREGYSGAKSFAYIEPYGALGTYGSIAYAAGDLTISTSRNLVIGPFAAFDRALTANEQANLRSTQNWSMNSVNGSNIILPLSGRRRPR